MGIDAGVYIALSAVLIVVAVLGSLALVVVPYVLLNLCFTRFCREDT